ncbi:MAG: hypothetical protein RLZZ401_562, partial [Pseudomonadota bacterium]
MYALNALDIRRARAEDDGAIAALWRRAWASANPGTELTPLAHWLERVRTDFRPPCDTVLSLYDDNALAAFMVIDPLRGYVSQLFVDPLC